MWIGIDDTDSPRGGCTTWVLTELLALARDHRIDLIGEPRLVRLNPNIPWKTRGNAALAARFGHGAGPRHRLGTVHDRPIWSYATGRSLARAETEQFRDLAWRRVLELSRTETGTDPALVTVDRRLPGELYWKAVRTVVAPDEAVSVLKERGAWWRTRGDPRGLVGASAAVAWPGAHPTWELTSYRAPDRWGTPRDVGSSSVRDAARRHPELFLCHDPRTRRLLVAPHTPCPILMGIRATRPEPLFRARTEIRSEPVDRWVLFRTNQASGDHLTPRRVRDLAPFTSARIIVSVAATPTDLTGGHVRVSVRDRDGSPIDCLAFEPTKTLPGIVRSLRPGDRVVVSGSRGAEPVLRLESVRPIRLVPRRTTGKVPICPTCGRPGRSRGRMRGYRCPTCHRRWPPEARGETERPPHALLRTFDPTPSARRHLHPLTAET
jgi:tRNA(Ile2)-agmatinylcytidine synthase